jgi:hypothetical protein
MSDDLLHVLSGMEIDVDAPRAEAVRRRAHEELLRARPTPPLWQRVELAGLATFASIYAGWLFHAVGVALGH